MTPHGPDTATYEKAIRPEAEAPAHLGKDALAFMFETHLTPRVTPAAMGSTAVERDYYKCWRGLKSHFQPPGGQDRDGVATGEGRSGAGGRGWVAEVGGEGAANGCAAGSSFGKAVLSAGM